MNILGIQLDTVDLVIAATFPIIGVIEWAILDRFYDSFTNKAALKSRK